MQIKCPNGQKQWMSKLAKMKDVNKPCSIKQGLQKYRITSKGHKCFDCTHSVVPKGTTSQINVMAKI